MCAYVRVRVRACVVVWELSLLGSQVLSFPPHRYQMRGSGGDGLLALASAQKGDSALRGAPSPAYVILYSSWLIIPGGFRFGEWNTLGFSENMLAPGVNYQETKHLNRSFLLHFHWNKEYLMWKTVFVTNFVEDSIFKCIFSCANFTDFGKIILIILTYPFLLHSKNYILTENSE